MLPSARQGDTLDTVTPRWFRIAMFVSAAFWTAVGVSALAEGDYVNGGFNLALGVAWLLMALFRDRFAPRLEAALERQRARVEGQGALSFLPDSDSRPQSK